MSDEQRVFIYVTAMDEKVCPWCGPLEGSEFNEEDILVMFPHAQQTGANSYRVNLHYKYLFLLGECRCELHEKQKVAEREEQQSKHDKRGLKRKVVKARSLPDNRQIITYDTGEVIIARNRTWIAMAKSKPKRAKQDDPSAYWTEERLAKLNRKLDKFDAKVDKQPWIGGSKAVRGVYAFRSPAAGVRFTMREAINGLIAGGLASMLIPVIFFLIIPLIQTYIEWYTRVLIFNQQVKFERRKSEAYARIYRGLNAT